MWILTYWSEKAGYKVLTSNCSLWLTSACFFGSLGNSESSFPYAWTKYTIIARLKQKRRLLKNVYNYCWVHIVFLVQSVSNVLLPPTNYLTCISNQINITIHILYWVIVIRKYWLRITTLWQGYIAEMFLIIILLYLLQNFIIYNLGTCFDPSAIDIRRNNYRRFKIK